MSDLERRIMALERLVDRLTGDQFGLPIHAVYSTTAGQSIAHNTVTIVDFDTLVADRGGYVTTGANWAFTCPQPGMYALTAIITLAQDAGWGGTEIAQIALYKNGALTTYLQRTPLLSLNAAASLTGAWQVPCEAGDTLDVRITQNSGAAIALITTAGFNRIAITRLGA